MDVAIYARVSTEGKGQDTENQLVQLRDFAERNKWKVYREYIDTVTGSGKKERLQFSALFGDASRRRFDAVLFWSLDRFSREGSRKTLEHLTKLDNWGVGFRSYTEQYLDSTGIFKDAVIAILGAVAAQERIRISERTIAGLARTKAKGTILGRRKRTFDVESAKARIAAGESYRQVAASIGVGVAVLHRAVSR